MIRAIVLNASDNLATLIDPGLAGEVVRLQGEISGEVRLLQDIPFGHKVCIAVTPKDSLVLKYGQVIGRASQIVQVGDHMHVHNIESARARGDLSKEAGK
jgi:altronate dehydratase small subunit